MSRDLGVSLFRTKYRLEWRHGFTRSEARKCTWLHKICIGGRRKRKPFLKRKNFCLKFIVLGCIIPLDFHHFAANTFFIYSESSSVNVVHFSGIYICFFWLSGLCPFRLGLFILVEFVLFFTRCEVLSLTSSISFRVNSYWLFLSDKFVLFCFVIYC